jgi:alcohol dehydrogenase (NADP+)
MSQKFVKLNTGALMPQLGIGTFLSEPGEVGQSVKIALEHGYRHIDCAAAYDNQKEIGHVLKEIFSEGKIKREDVFITSKLPAPNMKPDGIAAKLNETLEELQISYLDLYLLHQPVPCKKEGDKMVPQRGFGMHEVWKAMEALYHSGKVKAIGISNFPTIIVNDLLNYAKVPPAVQQIELHPYLPQLKHCEFLRTNGITITAYSPLGAPGFVKDNKPLIKNELVVDIAKKYRKTPAQVLIRWQIDQGHVVIPKSVKKERIHENFNVFDFQLDHGEVEALRKLDRNFRGFDQDWHQVPTFT